MSLVVSSDKQVVSSVAPPTLLSPQSDTPLILPAKPDLSAQEALNLEAFSQIVIPERFEKKHLIPAFMMPEVRRILKANLAVDPIATKDPFPGSDVKVYTTYTLHLDTSDLALTLGAKDNKLQPRFKLRIRTYEMRQGDTKLPNVALQIKMRTPQGWVIKGETKLSWEEYHSKIPQISRGFYRDIKLLKPNDAKQQKNLQEFCDLVVKLGARPILVVGYERESYLKAPTTFKIFPNGKNNPQLIVPRPFYSRASVDGRMRYLISTERFLGDTLAWSMPPPNEVTPEEIRKRWRTIKSDLDINGKSHSCYILELKGMPQQTEKWMNDLEAALRARHQDGYSKVYQALVQEMDFYKETRDQWGTLYGLGSPIPRRDILRSNRLVQPPYSLPEDAKVFISTGQPSKPNADKPLSDPKVTGSQVVEIFRRKFPWGTVVINRRESEDSIAVIQNENMIIFECGVSELKENSPAFEYPLMKAGTKANGRWLRGQVYEDRGLYHLCIKSTLNPFARFQTIGETIRSLGSVIPMMINSPYMPDGQKMIDIVIKGNRCVDTRLKDFYT